MLYNWLIVMKNGKELFVKLTYNKAEDLINGLIPSEINKRIFTVAELVNPDQEGNSSVIINSDEISHVLFKSK